jgi:hypothetical protein
MRNRIVLMCIVVAILAPVGFSQTSSPSATTTPPDTASIVGVWRGTWGGDGDGLPCISLTITNETGSLSGAILFYLLRKGEGQPLTASPGIPEPLIHPTFDGKTLTFQVSHRRAHPPASLNDPPVSFRLTLTGSDKGGLVNIGETPSGSESAGSSGLMMTRTAY